MAIGKMKDEFGQEYDPNIEGDAPLNGGGLMGGGGAASTPQTSVWSPLLPAMSGESPRERETTRTAKLRSSGRTQTGAGAKAAPPRPMTPTPQAGDQSAASSGVMPFQPIQGAGAGEMLGQVFGGGAQRRDPALMGSQGGLTGGGLGVPLDPVADEESDPISMLMKLLGGQ